MAYDGGSSWPGQKTRKPKYRTPRPKTPTKPGKYVPPGAGRPSWDRGDDGKRHPFRRHFGPQPPGQPREKRARVPFGKKKPKPKIGKVTPIQHPITILAGAVGLNLDPWDNIENLWPGHEFVPPFLEAMPSGWVRKCRCVPVPVAYHFDGPYFRRNAAAAPAAWCCLTNQGPITPNWVPGQVVDTNLIQNILMTMRRPQSTTFRDHYLEVWERPDLNTGNQFPGRLRKAKPQRGAVVISPAPSMPDPAVDPWAKPTPYPGPVPRPAPDPAPAPAPAPAPGQPYPAPQPQPGVITLPLFPQPGPWPNPQPGVPIPYPIPQPLPLPVGAPPYVVPGTSIDVTPSPAFPPGAPAPVVAPPTVTPGHIRMPPGRGTKEVKLGRNAVTEVMKGAINFFTESSDAVNAMFYAIDKGDRREAGAFGFMSPADKASFIYSNLHRVNWDEFARNYFKNLAEDFFYGSLGKGSAWMQQQGGISQGFKDAALSGGSSAGTSRGEADNPLLDALNELIDTVFPSDPGFNTPGRRAFAAKPVVKNWRRINKWTKRQRK